jgi:hypothetical protein
MTTHVFNIGQPYNDEWWAQNVAMGVITAGWEGEPGDKGTDVMATLNEGDTIIAFANGVGYLGYGEVLAGSTYEILKDKDLPVGWASVHRHIRGVRWEHVILHLEDGIRPNVAGRAAPRNTREAIPDEKLAEQLTAKIRKKSTATPPAPPRVPRTNWEWVFEAVYAINRMQSRPVTPKEVTQYIQRFRPDYLVANTGADLSMMTVNSQSRGSYPHKRVNGNMFSDPPQNNDLLYKEPFSLNGSRIGYVPYEPSKHGVWEMYPDERGKVRLVAPGTEISTIDAAYREALDEAEDTLPAAPIDGNEDLRKKVMGEIVQRQGQGKFRDDLLKAYDGTCAVTGSQTRAVLEAAHIKPYRGDGSDRVDNGLLLRSDIHTLFDLGLLLIDPDTYVIRVSKKLNDTEYASFEGKKLRVPQRKADRPLREHLEDHNKDANAPWLKVTSTD